MVDTIVSDVEGKMHKTIEKLKDDFGTIRGNRAHVSLVDGIKVDYYGTPTALSHLATISTPEPRTIVITPWDKNAIGEIEKGIMKSDLGLNPANDGSSIRINMPSLTEERRKDLVKVVKKHAEEARIALRHIRRDGNEALKTALKDKLITEDDEKRVMKKVQDLTDDYSKKVDHLTASKEKDIMEV